MKSPLTACWIPSPNHSGQRVFPVSRITPHCVVGHLSIESLGELFSDYTYQASSNYGIDDQGRVGCFVDESNRSWCSSSRDNDNRSITIECASDPASPYAMTPKVWDTLVALCQDIAKRYEKSRVLWIPDRDAALSYQTPPDDLLLTVHRWFAATDCPGDWLFSRMGDLADEINAGLSEEKVYYVYSLKTSSWKKAKSERDALRFAGFDGKILKGHVSKR